jgi:hypothetical protein
MKCHRDGVLHGPVSLHGGKFFCKGEAAFCMEVGLLAGCFPLEATGESVHRSARLLGVWGGRMV